MSIPRSSFDVVVVGGGVMGSSVAYHLMRSEPGLRVALVERDPSFATCSSALSVGNVRIQFSLEQNVRISQYAIEAFERFSEEMAVDGVAPEISFRREGNLFVVEEHAREAATAAVKLQRDLGCAAEWWSPETIRGQFPLYRPEGVAGGTWGADDGHLDGYAMLMGYRNKARALGAELLDGEVTGLIVLRSRVGGVRLADGASLSSPVVVCCAGAWSGELLAEAGIEIPVVPVQRQVYIVEPEVAPPLRLPLTGLPSGLYFRSEGEGRLLVGRSLPDDPVGTGFAWSSSRFERHLWPELAQFVPDFDRLRLIRGWTGLYAVNTLDGNALLGEWPELGGLYLTCGFSGHGLQQAPAVGNYLAGQVLGRRSGLDLSILAPERVLLDRPVRERALV